MKYIKVISICLLAFILTGCMDLQINYDLHDNKQPSLITTFYLNNNIYQELKTSPSQLIKQIKETSPQLNLWTYKIIKKNNQQTIKMTAPLDQAKTIYHYFDIKKEKDVTTYRFNLPKEVLKQIDLSEIKDYKDQINVLKALNTSFTLHLIFPKPIKTASIGEIHENELTIDLVEIIQKEKIPTLVVQCTHHQFNTLYIFIFIILLVLLILILIKKTSQKRDFKKIKNS